MTSPRPTYHARPKRRREPAPRRQPPRAHAWVGAQRLVVGVSFDRGSAQALERGHELARALGLELAVVHVLPDDDVRHRSEAVRRAFAHATRTASQRGALSVCAIALPTDSVRVRFGDVAKHLVHVARRHSGELLVIGGRSDDGLAPGARTAEIVRQSHGPVLLAGLRTGARQIVAATDLASEGVPVVRRAAEYAKRLCRRVSVIHNVDHGSQPPLLAPIERLSLAENLDRLRSIVRELDAVDDATVTREDIAAAGILRIARVRDADIVVVGVRPDIGSTSWSILASAQRSILLVPRPPHFAVERPSLETGAS